jgi:hypothetical protein
LSAERVSAALRDALPQPDKLVDLYRQDAVWYEAILEALAAIAVGDGELSEDTRHMVINFIDQPGVYPKFKRNCLYYLGKIA